jgi:hypothetical protein
LVGRVQDSIGSWIRSVASILDELASTGDARVRAADGTSLCPGSECGSTSDAGQWPLILILVLIAGNAFLAVAVIFAVRARRRGWRTIRHRLRMRTG